MANRQNRYLHWDKVIFALLKHKSYIAAAAALGVSRVTVWRYTQIPEFRRRWLQAQAAVYSEARAQLEAHANEAVAVVIQIMNDPKTKPADRLRASGYILGMRPTGLPLDDIELEDFEIDAPGFESDIPMEPPLSSVDRAFDGGHSSESVQSPDQPLTSEQRVVLAEFVEELIARRQSVSPESPKTATAAGAVIEPTSSPAVNPFTHSPTSINPIPQASPITQAATPAVGTPERTPPPNGTARPASNSEPNRFENVTVAPTTSDSRSNPPTLSALRPPAGKPEPSANLTTRPARSPQAAPSTDPATPVAASPQVNSNPDRPAAAQAHANRQISADVSEAQLRARESIQRVLEGDRRDPPK